MTSQPISDADYAKLSTEQQIVYARARASGEPYTLPWKRTREQNAVENERKINIARGRPGFVEKKNISDEEYERLSPEARIARGLSLGPSPEEIRRRRIAAQRA